MDTSGNPCVWENQYRCDACLDRHDDLVTTDEVDWSDDWSCHCNSSCPHCGAESEPYDSTWVGPHNKHLRRIWQQLPEKD